MMTRLTQANVRMLVLIASLPLTPPVSAQAPALSLEELPGLLKPSETVHVIDWSERKTKGTLGELSPSSLELLKHTPGPDGREVLVALVAMDAKPATAGAQTAGFGYAFGGPVVLVRGIGVHDSAWNVGGGGEKLRGPVGIGAELAYVDFPAAKRTTAYGFESSPAASAALLSVVGSYHFAGQDTAGRSARPFVTGGIGLLGTAGVVLNVGGGLDWWVTRRAGLRFDIRETVGLGFRGGVVFR